MRITRGAGDLAPVDFDSPFDSIQELEVAASLAFIGFVREIGSVAGSTATETEHDLPESYSVRISPAAKLAPDLVRSEWGELDSCIVEGVDNDYDVTTTVFNLDKGRGIKREQERFPEDQPPGPRYYPVEEKAFLRRIGGRLLQEIFQPGKRPELSALASEKKDSLIRPENVPLMLRKPGGPQIETATAVLGRLDVGHVSSLLDIYQDVAYPFGGGQQDWGPAAGAANRVAELHRILRAGAILNHVELRSGTVYYPPARQLFMLANYHSSWKLDDTMSTYLDPNTDPIYIGGMRFAFPSDIEMMTAYAQRSIALFDTEGIRAAKS